MRNNAVCIWPIFSILIDLSTYNKMAAEGEEVRPNRWYFSKEDLTNSPSRADGVDPEKELRYRQDAASLIQEMGPRLGLNPLCVSTAIVYMHRFYMINSFKAFDRGIIATAALFLAAKVEELPKKLEFVAKCSYSLLHKDAPPLEVPSEAYNKIVDDITFHELTILQTLGFDVQVKHPHPHVVECMNLVGVSKDLSQAAFFLAHNSQLLTTFCLQYSPTVVACMCIHLTCAWKGLEIPRSNDNKNWWEYVDRRVTQSKLEELAKEFLTIVGKSPTRLKKRIQENFKMAVEGSKPGSSSLSSGIHGNRHPPPPGSSSSGGSSNRQRDHNQHHLNVFNKHYGPHPPSSSKPSSSSHHHNPNKVHRTSPPPPPPPPSQPSQHSSHSTNNTTAGSHNNSPNKHKKHKDHHHMPPPGVRPDKHPLQDPNASAYKNKKMKMDESHQQHNKHHMSLNDYRQSKKHQQPMVKGGGGMAPPQKRKPPDSMISGSSGKPDHHHVPPPLPSNSTHYHPSAPPPSSHQSKSRVPHHNHSNSSLPPPLPPPLPSLPNHSPPPPPPPG